MEVSRYELILPLLSKQGKQIEGKKLLVNQLYGALDVVDENTAKALSQGTISEIDDKEQERLLRRGHLTEDPNREIEDMRILSRTARKIGRSTAGIVLLPTYDCNFRCSYCFEKHRLEKGDQWLQKTMSRELVDAIFRAVDGMKKRGMVIKGCTLFGGEPLLSKNIDLIRYISQKAKDHSMDISAITNGYELDSYIDLIKEFSFSSLQITLDGEKEENDRRRVHKDGGGSYDRILENVELAIRNNIKIELRINVGPANINTAYSLVHVFEERGLTKSEHFSYYFKATSGENYPGKDYGVSDPQIFEMLLNKGLSFEEAANHESEYISIKNELEELFEKKHYFTPSPNYCGSEAGMHVIDPAGLIYTCWDLVAREDYVIGMVDQEAGKFLFGFDMAKWRARTVQNMPKCSICPYLFSCRGGCAARAAEEGDFTKEVCGYAKVVFDRIASELAGKAYEKTKEGELSKSLKEPLDVIEKEQREVLLTSQSQKEIFEIVKHFFHKKEDEQK
jgi:uncharacterized protein